MKTDRCSSAVVLASDACIFVPVCALACEYTSAHAFEFVLECIFPPNLASPLKCVCAYACMSLRVRLLVPMRLRSAFSPR